MGRRTGDDAAASDKRTKKSRLEKSIALYCYWLGVLRRCTVVEVDFRMKVCWRSEFGGGEGGKGEGG